MLPDPIHASMHTNSICALPLPADAAVCIRGPQRPRLPATNPDADPVSYERFTELYHLRIISVASQRVQRLEQVVSNFPHIGVSKKD